MLPDVGTCILALAYADDIVLVAPTASVMHKMLSVCESFAGGFSLMCRSLGVCA